MKVHCQLKMLHRDSPFKFNCRLSTIPKKGEIVFLSGLEGYVAREEALAVFKNSLDSEDRLDLMVSVVEVMHFCLNSQETNKFQKAIADDASAVLYLEEKEEKLLPKWAP